MASPLHIEDATLRSAVELLDAGDVHSLREHLAQHPDLVRQHASFPDLNYFQHPTLLEFVAQNPIRGGSLPPNIVEVARVILDAGAKQDQPALDETLALVCSGRIPRECGVQIALIDLLCDHGADPDRAMPVALPHGEFAAAQALLRRGARMSLPVASALNRAGDVRELLGSASKDDRHRALALASQFGHAPIVRLLLDAGEDPSRYNPAGFHAHSTPLHQAAFAGHMDVVRLLVEHGARLDLKDTLWQGTPADWAEYAHKTEIQAFLRAREGP